MSQTLRLEYTCTKADIEEAETLNLRKRLGGGSKWRTRVVLFALVALMAVEFYVRILRDLQREYWILAVAGVAGLTMVVMLVTRKWRDKPRTATNVEVTAADFSILGPNSKVTMPWSAFSECLESPNLFVLVDRPKATLLVVPKRAFPSESWQTWFRAQTENRSVLAESRTAPEISTAASSAGAVAFKFKLGFRDYLDRSLASWRTWGLFFGIVILMAGTTFIQVIHPVPDAVNSPAKVFFVFELPFLMVLVPFMIIVVSLISWRTEKKHLGPQHGAFTDEHISFSGINGSGTTPWTSYARYKETRWSFILWCGRSSVWTMFPKRAFNTSEDVQRVRTLIGRKLKQSRWFLG